MSTDPEKLAFLLRRNLKSDPTRWGYLFLPIDSWEFGGSDRSINLNLPGNNERAIFGKETTNIYIDIGWKQMDLKVSGKTTDMFADNFSDLRNIDDNGLGHTHLYCYYDSPTHPDIKGRDLAAQLPWFWGEWFRGYWQHMQVGIPNFCSSGEFPFKPNGVQGLRQDSILRLDGIEYTLFEGRMRLPSLRAKSYEPDQVDVSFPFSIGQT